MESEIKKKIANTISEIVSLQFRVQTCLDSLVTVISEFEEGRERIEINNSGYYWGLCAFRDGMRRLKSIIRQNFNFVETLGLLSVTRYVFELLVWFHSISRDHKYGLSYRFQMMQKQIKYYQDFVEKAKLEIPVLKSYEEIESRNTENLIQKVKNSEVKLSPERWHAEMKFAQDELDRQARRKFSIYSNQAKHNGYGFQSYLVETQALPDLEDRLRRCVEEYEDALRLVDKTPPFGSWEKQDQLWKWKQEAQKCNMLEEYNFIYSFTSRLLHATPVSITTNQQLLEPDEMFLFLEYIYISLMDCVDLAYKCSNIEEKSEIAH